MKTRALWIPVRTLVHKAGVLRGMDQLRVSLYKVIVSLPCNGYTSI